MSNVKISALPTGTIAGTDTVPVVKAGVTTAVPFSHTHPQSDVTGLVADLATLQARTNPFPSLTALDQTSWSWVNQGGASISQSGGIVYFLTPSAVGENMRLRVVAAPATAYTITASIVPNPMVAVNFQACGICFYESSSSKVLSLLYRDSGSLEGRKNTNPTTLSSLGFATSTLRIAGGQFWLRLADNLTNITLSYSFDGSNFTQGFTEARGTFFTTAPDKVGIAMFNVGSGVDCGMSVLSWAQT